MDETARAIELGSQTELVCRLHDKVVARFILAYHDAAMKIPSGLLSFSELAVSSVYARLTALAPGQYKNLKAQWSEPLSIPEITHLQTVVDSKAKEYQASKKKPAMKKAVQRKRAAAQQNKGDHVLDI